MYPGSTSSPGGVSKRPRAPRLLGRLWFESAGPEHERLFLTYQRELRDGGSKVLNEAMLVLDIIDVKTTSLLAYISISLAAMVFLITSLPDSTNLHHPGVPETYLSLAILVVIVLLLTAILLCLSCLNIVGAHTIRMLAGKEQESQEDYEHLIVAVTLARRKRYLAAHRISFCTAILTLIIFAFLLGGSVTVL